MTAITIAVNTGNTDLAYGISGSEWVDIVPASDYLVFSNGSDVVADGETIPSESDFIQAGVLLTGIEQTVSKYFLADQSANQLKEISLMGNVDAQHVFAFDFDGATASEPVLELWDDSGLDTIDGTTLGAGTAANSWWRGITTTTASSGTNWVGSRLAGSGEGYFLWLNNQNGPLSVADTLYCQLKVVVPASAVTGGSAAPKIVVKYASN